jgi:amidase
MPQAVLAQLARVADQPQAGARDDAFVRFAQRGMQRHIEWLHGNEQRARHRARWAAFFERFDVLLCPVSGVPAIPHDPAGAPITRRITVNGAARPYMDLLAWTSIASGCQLPATVVPAGRTLSGLPVGLQIVGPYLEDRTPLDFAARITDVVGAFQQPPGY